MPESVGRVVRWDLHAGTGAVIVEGLPGEVRVEESAVQAPGQRTLQPGELVEIDYEHTATGTYRALRVCPTDGEP